MPDLHIAVAATSASISAPKTSGWQQVGMPIGFHLKQINMAGRRLPHVFHLGDIVILRVNLYGTNLNRLADKLFTDRDVNWGR
jgi:hypothetical protein